MKMNGAVKGLPLTHALLRLSEREGEIVALVAGGKSNKEIAEKLFVSVRTVENHRYRICKKLDLHGKGALKNWSEAILLHPFPFHNYLK